MDNNENGIALITALCLLMLVSLLAASAVMLSQYAEMDSYTYSSFTRSAYVAEGAATRIYWLILNDRKKYPQRSLHPDDNTQVEGERFQADGIPRRLEDYAEQTVNYQIIDAVNGMDVSGTMPQRDMLTMISNFDKNSAERRQLEMIGNRLQDYVDTDDLVRLNSMETKEYQAADLPHLPRNRPFQYREELLWIPGSHEICRPDANGRLSGVRLIAPKGLSPVSGRPSLYSTPVDQIAGRCKLSAIEADQLKDAFTSWTTEQKPLKDSLPAGFLKRLEMYYGNSESGYYTILIDTASPNQPGMRLAITFKAEFTEQTTREFYEFMFY